MPSVRRAPAPNPRHAATETGFAAPSNPLVIVGMHRSGTSLVSGLLTALGVFVDPEWPPQPDGGSVRIPSAEQRRNGYGEATVFRLANEALLAAADASWDYPEPFLARRGNPHFDERCLKALERRLQRNLRTGFFEPFAASGCAVWGWKDPRTSLTLPYWLRFFPGMHVVHVLREPAGVSQSILRRAAAWAEQAAASPSLYARLRQAGSHPGAACRRAAAKLGLTGPVRVPALDDARARTLQALYVRECREWGPRAAAYLEIRYEALLEDPASAVRDLARFADLTASPERLAAAARIVERGAPTSPASSTATPEARPGRQQPRLLRGAAAPDEQSCR